MFLLDTCTLLWLVADPSKLPTKVIAFIQNHPDGLYISAISAFEIAIKTRQKKLKLPLSVEKWYAQALTHHGVTEIPVDGGVALKSVALPAHHADPCDRMIIATAQKHKMTVLTPDQYIHKYRQVKTCWA